MSPPTHRTAISNEQIRTVSEREVAFTIRGDSNGGKRLVRLMGTEFLRSFMLHILPMGIKPIRHYGVLATSCKGINPAAARAALQVPMPNTQAIESAKALMCCDRHRCRPTTAHRSVVMGQVVLRGKDLIGRYK